MKNKKEKRKKRKYKLDTLQPPCILHSLQTFMNQSILSVLILIIAPYSYYECKLFL